MPRASEVDVHRVLPLPGLNGKELSARQQQRVTSFIRSRYRANYRADPDAVVAVLRSAFRLDVPKQERLRTVGKAYKVIMRAALREIDAELDT